MKYLPIIKLLVGGTFSLLFSFVFAVCSGIRFGEYFVGESTAARIMLWICQSLALLIAGAGLVMFGLSINKIFDPLRDPAEPHRPCDDEPSLKEIKPIECPRCNMVCASLTVSNQCPYCRQRIEA